MGSGRLTPPREGDLSVVEAYETRDRIHGYANEKAAIEAVVDAAVVGNVEGCDVLVMAPTNRLVEQINATMTERLLDAGQLDRSEAIDIGGNRFHIGQPVVTRANDRRLIHGPSREEWVRNGDRWTVLAGTETSCTSSIERRAIAKRSRPSTSRQVT